MRKSRRKAPPKPGKIIRHPKVGERLVKGPVGMKSRPKHKVTAVHHTKWSRNPATRRSSPPRVALEEEGAAKGWGFSHRGSSDKRVRSKPTSSSFNLKHPRRKDGKFRKK